MSVDLCHDNNSSKGISPRISFSHDLNQSEIVPIEPHIPFKSSFDFDFDIGRRSNDHESSMADELFANGILIPTPFQPKTIPIMSKSLSSSKLETEEKQGSNNNNNDSKSFWKFKRSKSLNCGSIYSGGFCPIPLLSRSKSTDSSKKSLISKEEPQSLRMNMKYSTYNQKPPLKKNYGVVHVSPILNVPSGKFLGFGSMFSSGKDKSKKK